MPREMTENSAAAGLLIHQQQTEQADRRLLK